MKFNNFARARSLSSIVCLALSICFEGALPVCRTSRRSSRKSSTRSTTRRGTASWGATSARTWRTRRATSSTSTWARWPSCCSRAARRGSAPSKFYVVSTDAVLPTGPECPGGVWVWEWVWEWVRMCECDECAARHATRTSLEPTVYNFRCWTLAASNLFTS